MQGHIVSQAVYGGTITENSQRTLERKVEFTVKREKKKTRKFKGFHHGEITR